MFLIAGGSMDPNLRGLASRCAARNIETHLIWVGRNSVPRVTWDVVDDRLILGRTEVRPSGAFVRYDVFSELEDPRPAVAQRAHAWFTAIQGWLMAHDKVAIVNREAGLRITNKPQMLARAKELGLAVPFTVVSNEIDQITPVLDSLALVVKPVDGGGYCEMAADVLLTSESIGGVAAAPAILQPRLVAPEIRLYRIGDECFGFRMDSEELDYRRKPTCEIIPITLDTLPPLIVSRFFRLCDSVGLDFAAADFKTCADTDELMFLELNSSPMFAAFDAIVDGRLSDAIVDWLAIAE